MTRRLRAHRAGAAAPPCPPPLVVAENSDVLTSRHTEGGMRHTAFSNKERTRRGAAPAFFERGRGDSFKRGRRESSGDACLHARESEWRWAGGQAGRRGLWRCNKSRADENNRLGLGRVGVAGARSQRGVSIHGASSSRSSRSSSSSSSSSRGQRNGFRLYKATRPQRERCFFVTHKQPAAPAAAAAAAGAGSAGGHTRHYRGGRDASPCGQKPNTRVTTRKRNVCEHAK